MNRWKMMNAASFFIVGAIAVVWFPSKLYPTLAVAPPIFRVEGMNFSNIAGVTVLPQSELTPFVFPEGRKSAPKFSPKSPSVLTLDPPGAFPIPTDIHSKTELIPMDPNANIVLIHH